MLKKALYNVLFLIFGISSFDPGIIVDILITFLWLLFFSHQYEFIFTLSLFTRSLRLNSLDLIKKVGIFLIELSIGCRSLSEWSSFSLLGYAISKSPLILERPWPIKWRPNERFCSCWYLRIIAEMITGRVINRFSFRLFLGFLLFLFPRTLRWFFAVKWWRQGSGACWYGMWIVVGRIDVRVIRVDHRLNHSRWHRSPFLHLVLFPTTEAGLLNIRRSEYLIVSRWGVWPWWITWWTSFVSICSQVILFAVWFCRVWRRQISFCSFPASRRLTGRRRVVFA